MSGLLPFDRVFLIRLSSTAEPAAGIHQGRIEHIRSGRTTQFSSMENIQEFIKEVLSDEKSRKIVGDSNHV